MINNRGHNGWYSLLRASVVALLVGVSLVAESQTAGQTRYMLTFRNGAGYGSFRDVGTSPRPYEELSIGPGLVFSAELKGWTFAGGFETLGGLSTSKVKALIKKQQYTGYFGAGDVFVEARKTIWRNLEETWKIDLGGGLSNYTRVSYASKFQNASFALSDLFQPYFIFRAEYTIADTRSMAKLPGWFSAFGELRIAPIGLTYRPGFAYIDNYTSGRETADYIFSSYRTGVAWLPYTSMAAGVRFNLRSGNRIGLAYRWSYRSTHGSDYWQYDEARHQIMVDFIFLLKKK